MYLWVLTKGILKTSVMKTEKRLTKIKALYFRIKTTKISCRTISCQVYTKPLTCAQFGGRKSITRSTPRSAVSFMQADRKVVLFSMSIIQTVKHHFLLTKITFIKQKPITNCFEISMTTIFYLKNTACKHRKLRKCRD